MEIYRYNWHICQMKMWLVCVVHVIAVFGMETVGCNWPLFKTLESHGCVTGYRSQNLWNSYLDLFSIKQLFLMYIL